MSLTKIAFFATLFSFLILAGGEDTVAIKLTSNTIATVPTNFAGFSVEVPGAKEMVGISETKQSWIQLNNNLRVTPDSSGPIMRIGGNSADESIWNPDHKKVPKGDNYNITSVDLLALKRALPLYNGTCVIDVNFRDATDPKWAVDHIKGVHEYLGMEHVKAIEIGNECDLFANNGIRPSDYTFSEYLSEFKTYANALYALDFVKKPKIQGATFCCGHFDSGISEYIDIDASLLKTFSYHRYPQSSCGNSKASLEGLLDDAATKGQVERMKPFIDDAHKHNIPFYLGECNSVSCGGQKNVSDVLAAALWAVDFMFNFAAAGISGCNFHGGPHSTYAAINYIPDDSTVPQVMPLYYAMWIFARVTAHHAQIKEVEVTSSNDKIKVWAVKREEKDVVVAIHKDYKSTTHATVTVEPEKAGSGDAELLKLRGKDGILSRFGLDFAGHTFDGSKDGKPQGTYNPEKVSAKDGKFEFSLEPATIAVLHLP